MFGEVSGMVTTSSTQAEAEQQARYLLTSSQAAELMQHALSTQIPAENVAIASQRIHHRPGMGVSMDYEVTYTLGQTPYKERMVASTATNLPQDPAPGVAYLQSDQIRIAVWRMKDDPFLPGLHTVFDQVWVSQLFDQVQAPAGELSWQVLAYRPTRRSVIRLVRSGVVLYVKVVPPKKAADLATRMQWVAQAVPAPQVVASLDTGVVVATSARGQSLAHAIAAGHPLPTPADILALIRSLPAQGLELRRRSSWADRIDFHAAAAASRLPEHADRIGALREQLEALRDSSPAGPVVVTHGDLYEANMFVEDGQISGIIDVDSLGPGHLVDDVATLLAHLAVLPDLAPSTYPNVATQVQQWWSEFARSIDPVALTARSAAVILSLVAGGEGPHALARLELAEQWGLHAQALAAPAGSSPVGSAPAASSPAACSPAPSSPVAAWSSPQQKFT